jgi:beta-glucosidase
LAGLNNILGDQCDIKYARGFKVSKENKLEPELIEEAVEIAQKADAAIIFGGWIHNMENKKWGRDALDAEGVDKPDIQMPFHQNELIKAVLEVNPNTVIVLFGGGAIDMSQWVDKTRAIVQVWYPGMEGGHAIADILFGKVNPSGKLPVTFPKKLEDHPAHKLGEYPGQDMEITYHDDIFVGYRYFDTYEVEPLFCFGHGLSYTQFEYTNIKIKHKRNHILASIEIINAGDMDGAEVVQLYISKPESSIEKPVKELRRFNKVSLMNGEETTVTFTLTDKDFSYFNEPQQKWVIEPGEYQLLIGSSSKDIRISGSITL